MITVWNAARVRVLVVPLAAALFMAASGAAADEPTPVINVGTHDLLPNAAGQQILIFTSGARQVQGLNFNIQIQAGGPPLVAVDIENGTIFAGNNNGTTDLDGPHPDALPEIEVRSMTTSSGYVSTAGRLAAVTLDTTGFSSGEWTLSMSSTLNGPTDFAGIAADITDGVVRIFVDSDGDGVRDPEDNCPAAANPGQSDLDGDDAGDACDGDRDEDGAANEADCAPDDDGRWRSAAYPDGDGDGVRDTTAAETLSCFGADAPAGYTLALNGPDNCPAAANPDQSDLDGDGTGDACEPEPHRGKPLLDFDGDGFSEIVLTPYKPAADPVANLVFNLRTGAQWIAYQARGDRLVCADYDGDGRTDWALIRPVRGEWLWSVRPSAASGDLEAVFGGVRDTPLFNCDFNGDRRADAALIAAGGALEFRLSLNAATQSVRLPRRLIAGLRQILCADLDGDGTDELLALALRGARRKPVMSALSLEGGVLMRRGLKRVQGLVSLDLNGDGAEEAGYHRRLPKSRAQLSFWAEPGRAVETPRIAEISGLRLAGPSGAPVAALVLSRAKGGLWVLRAPDLMPEELAGVDRPPGMALLPAVGAIMTTRGRARRGGAVWPPAL